jgi:hypothetical protein
MLETSPFAAFLTWSDWLHARVARTDNIALIRLMELLFDFLQTERKLEARGVAEALWRDYQRGGRQDRPPFLRAFLPDADRVARRPGPPSLKRQARHLAA